MPTSAGDNTSLSINPATGETLSAWPMAEPQGVEDAIARAARAGVTWRRQPLAARAAAMTAIAAELRARKANLARLITLEMGKPLSESMAEVEKSAWNCEYVAEHGPEWLADQVVPTQARASYIAHLPLGVVLSVLPWNFPVWQIFRCAASALMAGNTLLVKHAPNVQGCANAVAELLLAAGLPEGVFQNLHAPVPLVGAIIADARVAAVTLTGSPAAGAKVAAQAGAACKKTVLELGGSDAFIVLADADLDAAVAAGVRARFTNCGQVCLAAKRFIVEAQVAEAFTTKFAAAAAALRTGDPLEPSTQMGPMARADLREGLSRQINASLQRGARLLTGGSEIGRPGWFHQPTVLTDVSAQMPVVTEETFGPVAAIQQAGSAVEAIAMANDSAFGLSAMLWSSDLARARALARELVVGSVFINSVTASDPRLPVGGVKLSGYGRELGRTGMLELCNLQTVWVA
ncbi:MAG TPA: aldehyde dehydrogenase family protein [Steroidobacteraceae bacterium]|nr:aldehyde dehydrogenase family protein [Steroidobacteraceae bacterium]